MSDNPHLSAVLERIDADLEQSLERLFDLMRIPSVSTEAAHRADCRRAADWLVAELQDIGFEAELIDMGVEGGHPMVVGRTPGASARPRALFYGHYDVQPVDPLDLWEHDPFAPFVQERPNGSKMIRGRGASDDKGQLMTFLEACRAWKEVAGGPPCDLAILIEGEEEAGGVSMGPFLKAHGEKAQAEVALVCDTSMWSADRPAITTSLRGMAGGTLTIRAADRDLHSGFFGDPARNPLQLLVKILDDLRDAETGAITLPGFYDGVPETTDDIKALWRELGFDPKAFLGEIGLAEPAGEKDRSALEQIWARPTAEINGIGGGYQGDGFKTVSAAEAMAKISFRLVGAQDPAAIWRAFEAHVAARTPDGCVYELVSYAEAPASRLDFGDPDLLAASEALEAEWGAKTALIGAGGSIPVVGDFKSQLGMETLLIGFALDGDRIHSPNEKYELQSFHKGARSWARILAAFAERTRA